MVMIVIGDDVDGKEGQQQQVQKCMWFCGCRGAEVLQRFKRSAGKGIALVQSKCSTGAEQVQSAEQVQRCKLHRCRGAVAAEY